MSRCQKDFAIWVRMLRRKSAALQSQLTRLDLVSREEFDVQTQVLLRTREKLALLEQRLNDLENRPATTRQRRAAVKNGPSGARLR